MPFLLGHFFSITKLTSSSKRGWYMAGKLQKLGLDKRIRELMTDGVGTAREVREILLQENPKLRIGLSTVEKFIAGERDDLQDRAQKALRRHVAGHIDADLKVLEDLERQCLAWATEDSKSQLHRMAEAAHQIRGEIPRWQAMILAADPEDNSSVERTVKDIIARCTAYVLEDNRMILERLKAVNKILQIIDLKLRHAGALHGEGQGRILLYMQDPSGAKGAGADGDGYREFNFGTTDLSDAEDEGASDG